MHSLVDTVNLELCSQIGIKELSNAERGLEPNLEALSKIYNSLRFIQGQEVENQEIRGYYGYCSAAKIWEALEKAKIGQREIIETFEAITQKHDYQTGHVERARRFLIALSRVCCLSLPSTRCSCSEIPEGVKDFAYKR